MNKRSISCAACLAFLTLLSMGMPLRAQEKPDSPEPKIAADQPILPKADKDADDEVPKRIFWIIPNFMTANDQPENYSAHFGNLLQASISQAANAIPHYGQGWGAFGKRYLAQEGDQFTGSMLIYGVLPNMLHQDPRYFRKGRGSKWSRIAYAASRVVIARTDSGKPTFNPSTVFGQLGQASISMLYYPKQDREISGILTGWGINQGYNIGWNQLKEWTPDLGAFLKRHGKKHKQKEINDARSPITASVSN